MTTDIKPQQEEWFAVDLILKVANAKDMIELFLTVYAATLKLQSENVELMEADIVLIDPNTYLPVYEDDGSVKPTIMYSTGDPNTFYGEDGFYTI